MKLSEKKFICDVASVILAAGVLICGFVLFINRNIFLELLPLIFSFGALMFFSMFFRNRFGKNRRRMIIHGILALVLVVFALVSAVLEGGLL